VHTKGVVVILQNSKVFDSELQNIGFLQLVEVFAVISASQ